jgi:hypothetical protein
MHENFLHRDRIDWDRLRRETFDRAEDAQSSVETYAAIRFALAQLGDRHSFLQLTPALAREESSRRAPAVDPAPAATRAPSRPPSPLQMRRSACSAAWSGGSIIETAPRPLARIVVPFLSDRIRTASPQSFKPSLRI